MSYHCQVLELFFFQKSAILYYCYIALSVSDKKSSLESNKTLKSNKELEVLDDSSDEFSSDGNDESYYDEDSSSGDSSSEDEIHF